MKKLKVAKYVLPLLAIVYLVCVFAMPALEGLRHNFVAWLVFVIYLFNVIFLWGICRKQKIHPADEDENYELEISKKLFTERGKWYW